MPATLYCMTASSELTRHVLEGALLDRTVEDHGAGWQMTTAVAVVFSWLWEIRLTRRKKIDCRLTSKKVSIKVSYVSMYRCIPVVNCFLTRVTFM
jgi:hypothetical protein